MLASCLGGCVQRRMMIRSNPPGAAVYLDEEQIGTTPIAHNFTYYGKRKIRLVKDGYETLTVLQSVPPPWYQIPPLDFVSENLVPGEIRDTQTFTYQLVPQAVVPTDLLLTRAEELRGSTQPVIGELPVDGGVPIDGEVPIDGSLGVPGNLPPSALPPSGIPYGAPPASGNPAGTPLPYGQPTTPPMGIAPPAMSGPSMPSTTLADPNWRGDRPGTSTMPGVGGQPLYPLPPR